MATDLKIDCSKMSNLTKQLLGSSIFADLVEHFNNPENQKRFEEWKRERKSCKEVFYGKAGLQRNAEVLN